MIVHYKPSTSIFSIPYHPDLKGNKKKGANEISPVVLTQRVCSALQQRGQDQSSGAWAEKNFNPLVIGVLSCSWAQKRAG